jgi:hypothetical protein
MRKLITLICLFNSIFFIAQNKYKVVSIDSYPAIRHYEIKLVDNKIANDTILLLSKYDDSSNVKRKKIHVGNKLRIHPKQYLESENPFILLLSDIRIRRNAVFIDDKLYDTRKKYFYSNCIRDLYYIKRCK